MQYTILSTVILGILFVVLTYFLFYIFKKFKIKINEKLLYGLIPWVVAAAFARVAEDAGVYPDTFFTTTPGIILVFTAVLLAVFFIGIQIEKKKKFALWKTLAISGIIMSAVQFPFLKFVNFYGAEVIIIVFAIALGAALIVRKFVKIDNLSFYAIAAQLFDASATFTSLTYFNYYEQHVLPTFLISITGPWIMFPLKLAVIIPIIYLLNKYCDDKELRKFIMIAIFVLGLAPGLRDTLRLVAGV